MAGELTVGPLWNRVSAELNAGVTIRAVGQRDILPTTFGGMALQPGIVRGFVSLGLQLDLE